MFHSPSRRPIRNRSVVSRKNRLRLEILEDRNLLSGSPLPVVSFPSLQVDPNSYDTTSILVRFYPGAEIGFSLPGGLSAQESPGTEIGEKIGKSQGLYRVNLGLGVDVTTTISAYQNKPMVLYAQPDYRLTVSAIPNDPSFDNMWQLNNLGQTSGTIDADLDAPAAWDVHTGSGSTIVAVIDTGVDYNHVDLAANMWVNMGETPGDGIDNDGNGYVDDIHGYDFINHDGSPLDDHGHGTHVAGTIGAVGNNGIGVTGINWNVKIMALKFLGADGSGSTSDAIEAIEYAVANGARVSNNSYGGDPYDQALNDAIAAAGNEGHIYVAAAGNGDFLGQGINNDQTPFYPAGYNLDNIIAVAASDHNDNLATFSNYGATTVDLAAPGVDILSTLPGNSYGLNSGTSMATPHVAGVVTLLWDLHPEWTYQQVINQILSTVDHSPSLIGATASGGRLNAAAALGNPEPPPPPPAPATLPFFDDFQDGVANHFQPQIGSWSVSDGRYDVRPSVNNDNLPAISTLPVDGSLPANLEIQARINANEGFLSIFGFIITDYLTTGFLVFDFQDYNNFKFAGANMDTNQWVIGHYNGLTWSADATLSQTLDAATDYDVKLRIDNSNQVTLLSNEMVLLTHTYGESLVDGDVGLGVRNSVTHFDNVIVREIQPPPPPGAFPILEDFGDGVADHFREQTGLWTIDNGRYHIAPFAGGDGISTLNIADPLPAELDIQATMRSNAVPGLFLNSFVIFDYQNPLDFKYAGAFVGSDRWVIGQRTVSGWQDLASLSEVIDTGTEYDIRVVVRDGTEVTLNVDNANKLTYEFAGAVNDGEVGVGTQNGDSEFDDFVVQVYEPPPPPQPGMLPIQEDFEDGEANYFQEQLGNWVVSAGRYTVTPAPGSDAVSTLLIGEGLPVDLDVQATFNSQVVSGRYLNSFIIFDYHSPTDFKYAGAFVGSGRWVIGQRGTGGWVDTVTLSESISTGTDYDLRLIVENSVDVRMEVDGVAKLSHSFSSPVNDGEVGVGTQNGVSKFDDILVQVYTPPPPPPSGTLPILEDFEDGIADYFEEELGAWLVTGGRYKVTPAVGSDAISTVRVADSLPYNLEVKTTFTSIPVSGSFTNGFVIFDYHGPTDYKYAGAYVGSDLWVIGQQTSSGRQDLVTLPEIIDVNVDYQMQLLVDSATNVTLKVGGVKKLTYNFTSPVNDGDVGIGTQNAVSRFDNVEVKDYTPPPSGSIPFLETFDDGVADFFEPKLGTWNVNSGRYEVTPAPNSDTVSTIFIGGTLPTNLELAATFQAIAVPGRFNNSFVIFDYHGPTDFKYAGAFVGSDKWVIGQRTGSGWQDSVFATGVIDVGIDYHLQIFIEGGNKVKLKVDGVEKLTHTFTSPVNDGVVGVGTQNAFSLFDNVEVKNYTPPPPGSLPIVEDFNDGVANLFTAKSGTWNVNAGHYEVTPSSGSDAVSTIQTATSLPANLEVTATFNVAQVPGRFLNGFIIFDYHGPTDFKYAGAFVGSDRWVIGQRTAGGWQDLALFSEVIDTYTDYQIRVRIQNSNQVSLAVGGVTKVTYTFGSTVNDGAVGLGTQNSITFFDDVTVKEYTGS